MRAHLVVIGSGTTGLSLALEAARRTDSLSAPVVLFAASETICPRLELCRHDLANTELALELRHGLRFWSGIRSQTGRDPGWNPCGAVVELGESEDLSGWNRLRELGASIRREGEKVFDDDAGTLEGGSARSCLESLAREAGAVVRMGEVAISVSVNPGQPLRVTTTTGEVTCDAVVLAGAGASALSPGGGPRLVSRTWRECSFGEEEEPLEEAREADPLVLDFLPSGELDTVAVEEALQESFGGIEAGRARVRARVRGDLIAAPERTERIWVGSAEEPLEAAADLASRALGEVTSGEERTRVFWESPDGAPIIGPVPDCAGLWVACGFGLRAGLLAPACAEGVAARILEGGSGWFDRELYDPARPGVNWPERSR